jgi:plastocyanin
VHRTSKAALAAALCSLAVPGVAGAATKTVSAGPELKKPPAGVPKDAYVNAFFPRSIAVHAGDALKFRFAGFHAVNFAGAGETPPPLALPAPGITVAGAKDATGAGFWFNGQPQLIFNPTLVAGTPSGRAYDGSKAVYSGAPLSDGPPKPWSVKLTKAGTYSFFCIIHPGMKGTVKVVAKGEGVPSAKADAAHVKAQLAKAIKNLKKLAQRKAPPGNVITAGPDLPSGETLARFTPADKKVKAGTAVTLTMADGTTETHSFTFARDAATLKKVAQGFIAPLPNSPAGAPPMLGLSAQGAYPSDAPLPPYDGTQHGDGFLNTGVLDGDPKSPLPQRATVTFAKAGTYQYICVIHPEMHGKVIVTS